MYCIVIYAYFPDNSGGHSPLLSFEFILEKIDDQVIADKKRAVGSQWSGRDPDQIVPNVLVHGIFKL